jgi:hypothetical protein
MNHGQRAAPRLARAPLPGRWITKQDNQLLAGILTLDRA